MPGNEAKCVCCTAHLLCISTAEGDGKVSSQLHPGFLTKLKSPHCSQSSILCHLMGQLVRRLLPQLTLLGQLGWRGEEEWREGGRREAGRKEGGG